MDNTRMLQIGAIGLILLIAVVWMASSSEDETPAARITSLYDAFGEPSDLRKDWGYAALIEYGGKRILFDTGNNADIFEHNVDELDVDLTDLDFVVVSHRHGDHTSGLNYLLKANPDAKIYAPQENFGVFGAALPGTFYKRNENSPPKMRYFDGETHETLRFGSPWPEAQFEWITKTTEVAPGFHLIMLHGTWGVDLEVRELSLAIDTPDGIVLVVGCGHPELEKIIAAATQNLGKPIHLVIGGLHLLPAGTDEIKTIATSLRDHWKVSYVAPAHCTGERAFAILKETFGDRYLYAGLGTTVALGPKVTTTGVSDARTHPSMHTEDLKTYRKIATRYYHLAMRQRLKTQPRDGHQSWAARFAHRH